MPSDERQPLLPTNNRHVNEAQPSKATAFKLAEVLAAFKAGKLPTQEQINRALEKFKNSSVLQPGPVGRTARYSPQGEQVVEDVRAVIDSLERFGKEKNGDDKLQRFIYHTSKASLEIDTGDIQTTVSQRELRKDAQQALDSLRTLGNLILTSGEFRNILNEVTLLFRDLFADAAETVAEKAREAAEETRPSQEERERGVDFKKAKKKSKQIKQQYETGELDAEARKQLAEGRKWVDEASPTDAKDAVIERLRKVIVDIQSKPDYHRAVDTLINLGKKYASRAADTLHAATEKAEDKTQADVHTQEALKLLREIVETYAGGKSLDGLLKALDKVVRDIKDDDRLREYFDDVSAYVDRVLHQPGYVASQRAARKAEDLYDRAQELIQSNTEWKRDVHELVKQLQDYKQAFENDPVTAELFRNIEILSEDLSEFTREGIDVLSSKSEGLYRDLFDVVIPRLLSEIKEIPLPRLEFKSETIDVAIDDFKLESESFIPDLIKITNHNDLLAEQGYAAFATNFDSTVKLHVEGLRIHAKDIAYYINKKTSWQYEDSGLLSIDVGGKGLSFDVALERAHEDDRERYFKVKKVDVDLGELDYSVSQSDHSVLNWLAKPWIRPIFHDSIQQTLEGQIRSWLEELDIELFAFHQRLVAATAARPSISNYFRALFASGGSPFSSSSTRTRPTQKGVITTGKHGEWVLAIGVDEQILPGRAGPSANYEKRKKAVEEAKRARERLGITADSLSGAVQQAKGVVKQQGQKISHEARRKEIEERAKDDWKSQAFDV